MFSGLARLLIRSYQLVLRPYLGPRCRFFPSCSDFALEAIELHGLFSGGRLTVQRLCRCHPWGRSGLDPVPISTESTESSKAH
jgi:putative membrane protein insertion efficiency factor